MGERIAVIVAQKAQGHPICAQLQRAGYEAALLCLSPEVHLLLPELAPQMVIYDCNECNDLNITVLHNIRAITQVPILVLSPRHSEALVVNALREGADGCLCKPYGEPELLARVEAHLRRHFQWEDSNRDLTKDEVLVDELAHSVVADGREVRLTPTEYRLLRYLVERNGGVATREELRDYVWGTDTEARPNSLGLHIYSLRKKLERDPHRPQHIITKRGIGYYLAWKARREPPELG